VEHHSTWRRVVGSCGAAAVALTPSRPHIDLYDNARTWNT
jgi:hypothetical protein